MNPLSAPYMQPITMQTNSIQMLIFSSILFLRLVFVFGFALVGVFAIDNLRLEGSVFTEQNTMDPMLGLYNRERENLRFHVSIIA